MNYTRRRNYQRLDTNHDGQLSFEEWAVRSIQKFTGADANRDRALDRTEFATTAPRPRRTTAAARCDCTTRTASSAGGRAAAGR